MSGNIWLRSACFQWSPVDFSPALNVYLQAMSGKMIQHTGSVVFQIAQCRYTPSPSPPPPPKKVNCIFMLLELSK